MHAQQANERTAALLLIGCCRLWITLIGDCLRWLTNDQEALLNSLIKKHHNSFKILNTNFFQLIFTLTGLTELAGLSWDRKKSRNVKQWFCTIAPHLPVHCGVAGQTLEWACLLRAYRSG